MGEFSSGGASSSFGGGGASSAFGGGTPINSSGGVGNTPYGPVAPSSYGGSSYSSNNQPNDASYFGLKTPYISSYSSPNQSSPSQSFSQPSNMFSDFGASASNAFNSYVAQPAQNAFNSYVAQPISNAFNSYVAQPAQNAFNDFGASASNAFNSYVAQPAQNAFNNFGPSASNAFNSFVPQSAQNAYNSYVAQPAQNAFNDFGASASNAFNSYVAQPSQNAFNSYVSQPAQNTFNNFGPSASNAFNSFIPQSAQNAFNSYVSQPTSNVFNNIGDGVKNTFDSYIGQPVSNAFSDVGSISPNAFKSIIPTFGAGSFISGNLPDFSAQSNAFKSQLDIRGLTGGAESTFNGDFKEPGAGYTNSKGVFVPYIDRSGNPITQSQLDAWNSGPLLTVDWSNYGKNAPYMSKLSERMDFVAPGDLGDRFTQNLVAHGMSLEQALNSQFNAAKSTPGSRDDLYFKNELEKSLQNNIGLSSQFHFQAMASGLPTGPNPYEYVGDRSLMLMKGLNGKDDYSMINSEGLGLTRGIGIQDVGWGNSVYDPMTTPDFTTGVNSITFDRWTGQMGEYGRLPLPTSTLVGGETRSLGLGDQILVGLAAKNGEENFGSRFYTPSPMFDFDRPAPFVAPQTGEEFGYGIDRIAPVGSNPYGYVNKGFNALSPSDPLRNLSNNTMNSLGGVGDSPYGPTQQTTSNMNGGNGAINMNVNGNLFTDFSSGVGAIGTAIGNAPTNFTNWLSGAKDTISPYIGMPTLGAGFLATSGETKSLPVAQSSSDPLSRLSVGGFVDFMKTGGVTMPTNTYTPITSNNNNNIPSNRGSNNPLEWWLMGAGSLLGGSAVTTIPSASKTNKNLYDVLNSTKPNDVFNSITNFGEKSVDTVGGFTRSLGSVTDMFGFNLYDTLNKGTQSGGKSTMQYIPGPLGWAAREGAQKRDTASQEGKDIGRTESQYGAYSDLGASFSKMLQSNPFTGSSLSEDRFNKDIKLAEDVWNDPNAGVKKKSLAALFMVGDSALKWGITKPEDAATLAAQSYLLAEAKVFEYGTAGTNWVAGKILSNPKVASNPYVVKGISWLGNHAIDAGFAGMIGGDLTRGEEKTITKNANGETITSYNRGGLFTADAPTFFKNVGTTGAQLGVFMGGGYASSSGGYFTPKGGKTSGGIGEVNTGGKGGSGGSGGGNPFKGKTYEGKTYTDASGNTRWQPFEGGKSYGETKGTNRQSSSSYNDKGPGSSGNSYSGRQTSQSTLDMMRDPTSPYYDLKTANIMARRMAKTGASTTGGGQGSYTAPSSMGKVNIKPYVDPMNIGKSFTQSKFGAGDVLQRYTSNKFDVGKNKMMDTYGTTSPEFYAKSVRDASVGKTPPSKSSFDIAKQKMMDTYGTTSPEFYTKSVRDASVGKTPPSKSSFDIAKQKMMDTYGTTSPEFYAKSVRDASVGKTYSIKDMLKPKTSEVTIPNKVKTQYASVSDIMSPKVKEMVKDSIISKKKNMEIEIRKSVTDLATRKSTKKDIKPYDYNIGISQFKKPKPEKLTKYERPGEVDIFRPTETGKIIRKEPSGLPDPFRRNENRVTNIESPKPVEIFRPGEPGKIKPREDPFKDNRPTKKDDTNGGKTGGGGGGLPGIPPFGGGGGGGASGFNPRGVGKNISELFRVGFGITDKTVNVFGKKKRR